MFSPSHHLLPHPPPKDMHKKFLPSYGTKPNLSNNHKFPNSHGLNVFFKDLEVKCVVFDCLHMVMFMSINPNETIDNFKAHGKEMVVESFDNL
jgi:hypothetical protein